MANCVIVMGKSGTGKSTSIKGLDPKETVVMNLLGKKLPFKGSKALYNLENKNLIQVEDYNEIITNLRGINEHGHNIKNIVIDDAIYVMRKEYFKRAKETGYAKYTELAQHFQQIIATCEQMREDINVFFMLHTEDIVSDNTIIGYKVATIGKLLDTQYSPVEVVPIVLLSDIKYDDKGVATFGFYTHRSRNGSMEIPATSPDGMFEQDFIPNNLGFVVKAMNEYYG